MTTRKAKGGKKYRVANPKGIAAGTHLLSYRDSRWYEGDLLRESDLPADALSSLVEQGYLVQE